MRSYRLRRGDAVKPGHGTFDETRVASSSKVRDKTPHTVWRCHPRNTRHFPDRGSLGSLQHRDDLALLRRTLRVRLWLRVRQGLNRRPQLIDQLIAAADLPAFFDTGHSIPQCQEPLTAKGAACDSSCEATAISPFTGCGRCVAAQRDSVIADNIDTWVGSPD